MQNGNTDKIWELLNTVPDPEIPIISVVELGAIHSVKWNNHKYIISITPTYSGCPAIKTFQDDIKYCFQKNGINNYELHIKYDPPWITDLMNESTKKKEKIATHSLPITAEGTKSLFLANRAITALQASPKDVIIPNKSP